MASVGKRSLKIIFRFLFKFFNLDKYSGRFPKLSQWKNFWKVTAGIEKILIILFALMFLVSSSLWALNFYYKNTEIKPASGFRYTEGVVGQPEYINPLFYTFNDIDRDLVSLIFSGLFKYDVQGNSIPDLAESFEIKDDGKIYEVLLKENVFWHDGTKFSADDVVFTIKSIQDPQLRSPQRFNWEKVKIEKVDAKTVIFRLENPYAQFLENLIQPILPKHALEGRDPRQLTLPGFYFNIKPIGTGPFKFKKFEEDPVTNFKKSYTLESYDKYFGQKPFLKTLEFVFFENEDQALASLLKGEVMAVSEISLEKESQVKEAGFNIYAFALPRYFAVFFNQTQSKPLADKNVRLALAYATDKQEIIDKVFEGKAAIVNSAIPPKIFGHSDNVKVYEFLPEHAKEILTNAQWQDENSDGWLEKIIKEKKRVGRRWIEEKTGEIPLEIGLVTVSDPLLPKVAQILKEQWQKIGVRINIEILDLTEIQQERIRPRDFDALLFGEALSLDPDPFSFWHSSQKREPELNLSLYENREVDKLLEEARKTQDRDLRFQKYERFQQVLADDLPAIFLYSPAYLYPISKEIKGIEPGNIIADPSKRFIGIENWYVKTRRTWR